MFKIVNKQLLAENVKRIDILAPVIASKILPGQFVSVSPDEDEERIPITVNEVDVKRGTIAIIFQEIGRLTRKIGAIPINDSLFSVLGPLGKPSRIEKVGRVICAAAGIGVAQILPIARAHKKIGNKVVGIIGARTKKFLMLEPQMRIACDRLFVTTDDGSYQRKAKITEILQELMAQKKINLVYAIGSVELMRNVCELAKKKTVPSLIKVNPYMVDCMGMCGSCRVKVDGLTKLACVDGPEFDGQKINFDDLDIRMKAFKELDQWYNQKSISSHTKKESGTFMKFLTDILRN